ncbi:MAG: DUF3795 domain-containing protein [Archaeoglobus sp.]|nr:DUF3795 domain-containing protein [Archaeoglobus sp.]
MSENLKNELKSTLIGCCGIYCGACPFYRSKIPDLAKMLKDALNAEKFNKIAVPFEWVGEYREFKKWLNFLARAKCEGCQAGGGNPFCSIRKCCRKKGFVSCAECDEFPCDKKFLKWISERYRNWNVKNIRRIKEIGYEKWLEEKEKEVNEGFVTGLVIKGMKRTGRTKHGKGGKGKIDPEQA